jgi:predicted anti-sigma-YlaC factor YlaD
MMSVTCRELIAFLDDYVAGELPPEPRALFEQHLEDCTSCREYLRGYRETIRLARTTGAEADTLPPDLVAAILATLK